MNRNIILIIKLKKLKWLFIPIVVFLLICIGFQNQVLSTVMGPLKQRVIVIDPGHGGIDGGANDRQFLEKDTNLAVALRLKKELTKSGAKVVLTRDEDEDLHSLTQGRSRHLRDLKARLQIIKQSKPDLFLSIHVNANKRRPSTTGPIIFYNKNLTNAQQLSQILQKQLNITASRNGFKQHQAQAGDYYLLNRSPYPGAIVELGFMSNLGEKEQLQSEEYQSKLAKTIAESVRKYYQGTRTFQEKIDRAEAVMASKSDDNVNLYFPVMDQDVFATESMEPSQPVLSKTFGPVEGIRAVVEGLISGPRGSNLEPVLDPKSSLRNVLLSKGIVTLNFSELKLLESQGSLSEFKAARSLVETVCQFPGVNGLRIQVNGQTMPTLGQHVDISKVMLPAKPKLRVAIVIDDLAGGNQGLEKMLSLNKPLTMAVMPLRETSRQSAELVHSKGLEVFLHIPMEPDHGKPSWLGPGAIISSMGPKEAARQVTEDLKNIPYVIGMNNHMGSKITKRKDLMIEILKIAKFRHLVFLDSRTTQDTVIPSVAKELNLTILERSVFIDGVNSLPEMRNQFKKLAAEAQEKGTAIAIGHVGVTGENTSRALAEMIPWLENQGIQLVFASQLIDHSK